MPESSETHAIQGWDRWTKIVKSVARLGRRTHTARSGRPPVWMRDLTLDVWNAERLSMIAPPAVRLGRPARSTRGFFSYSGDRPRILVRWHEDAGMMRSTLLHELAHAVHRLHYTQRALCACEPACSEDGHGPMFKRHLARIEHRHQPGTHSRWGFAGCLGRERVPARTPWHSNIECPRSQKATSSHRQATRR